MEEGDYVGWLVGWSSFAKEIPDEFSFGEIIGKRVVLVAVVGQFSLNESKKKIEREKGKREIGQSC